MPLPKRKIQLTLLLIIFLILFIDQSANAKWQIYKNQEFNIEFLVISLPKEVRFDSLEALKVIWHIGFMEDGLNGVVEANHLKDGSFRYFSVIDNAFHIRKGMEQSLKSKVISQQIVYVNGVPAIEFQTTTTTQKGSIWHGIVRMLVIEDTYYSIMIGSSNKDRLVKPDIIKYLDSLRFISQSK